MTNQVADFIKHYKAYNDVTVMCDGNIFFGFEHALTRVSDQTDFPDTCDTIGERLVWLSTEFDIQFVKNEFDK